MDEKRPRGEKVTLNRTRRINVIKKGANSKARNRRTANKNTKRVVPDRNRPERTLTPEEEGEAWRSIQEKGENTGHMEDDDTFVTKYIPSKQVDAPESYHGSTLTQIIMNIENDKIYKYILTTGMGSFVKQPLIEIDLDKYKDITAAEDGSMIDKEYKKGEPLSHQSLVSIYNALLHPEAISQIVPGSKPEHSIRINCPIKINQELEEAVSSPQKYTWRNGNQVPIAILLEVDRHVLIVILFNNKIYSIGVGVTHTFGDKVIINTPDFLDMGSTRIIDICIFTKSQLDWLKNFLMIGIVRSDVRLRFRRRINVADGYVLEALQIISNRTFAIASTGFRRTYNCAKFLNEFFKKRVLCTTLFGIYDPHACKSFFSLNGIPPASLVKAYFLLYLAGYYESGHNETGKNEAVTALQTLLNEPGKTHEEIESLIIDIFLSEGEAGALNSIRRFFSPPKRVGSTSTEAVKGGRRKIRNQRKSKTRKTRRSYSRKSA